MDCSVQNLAQRRYVTRSRLDLIWVYPIFWVATAISYPVVKARYR